MNVPSCMQVCLLLYISAFCHDSHGYFVHTCCLLYSVLSQTCFITAWLFRNDPERWRTLGECENLALPPVPTNSRWWTYRNCLFWCLDHWDIIVNTARKIYDSLPTSVCAAHGFISIIIRACMA